MDTRRAQSGSFLVGLAWGLALSLLVLVLTPLLGARPVAAGALLVQVAAQGWQLVQTHLQGSVWPFAAVMLVYLVQLQHLERALEEPDPTVERVARHEQLVDLCANLFFGIGVIWTAIGMREALVQGLGDPAVSATAGAFTVLQRLVDGGILLALSTTIVGGTGGYLMRVIKSVLLGDRITACYLRESQRPLDANLATLQRIEELMQERDAGKETP